MQMNISLLPSRQWTNYDKGYNVSSHTFICADSISFSNLPAITVLGSCAALPECLNDALY